MFVNWHNYGYCLCCCLSGLLYRAVYPSKPAARLSSSDCCRAFRWPYGGCWEDHPLPGGCGADCSMLTWAGNLTWRPDNRHERRLELNANPAEDAYNQTPAARPPYGRHFHKRLFQLSSIDCLLTWMFLLLYRACCSTGCCIRIACSMSPCWGPFCASWDRACTVGELSLPVWSVWLSFFSYLYRDALSSPRYTMIP